MKITVCALLIALAVMGCKKGEDVGENTDVRLSTFAAGNYEYSYGAILHNYRNQ